MTFAFFIFILLICCLVGISLIVNAIVSNILMICVVALILCSFVLVIKYGYNLWEDYHNFMYLVCDFFLLLYLTVGFILTFESLNMDSSNYYLGFLTTDSGLKTIITVTIVCTISMIILKCFTYCNTFVQVLLGFIQIAVMLISVIAIFLLSTKSFSDYETKEIINSEEKYTYTIVNGEAEIYYPSFRKENQFPSLSPVKISIDSFTEGTTVYCEYDVITSKDYVCVTNGEKSGYVDIMHLSHEY